MLDDGSYWLFYTLPGDTSSLAGFLQGTGGTSGATFISNDTRDFNLEGPSLIPATLSAGVAVRSTLSGSVTYPGDVGTGGFFATYDPDYEIVPTLAALAGSYSGQSALSGITVTMNIAGSGAISGSSGGGCGFSGWAVPRANGNVYAITITFGGLPCALPNTTFSGIGLLDIPARSLLAVGLNAARNEGFLFLGARPATAFGAATTKSAPAPAKGPTRTATGEPLVTFGRR